MDDRIEPQMAVDETTTLNEFLDYYRASLLLKLHGLDDDQIRLRSCPPSTLSLLGLVRHMAEVERHWFHCVLGGDDAPPLYYTDDDEDLDMHPPADATLAEALDTLATEVTFARAAVAAASPDQIARSQRHGHDVNVRWIMVHMIDEYARHCGHADLLREAIDGVTGD
jgi:uncharacterized damage-inducible protein DinB